jgi:shikimate dehydrogenase
MIKLGLVGYPLGHTLSPQIHCAALKSCGLDGDYYPYPIQPDDKRLLIDLLSCVRSGEITGLNVTIPHKQRVIEFLDGLTPAAQAIGAVNTLYMREGRLIGDNTDAQGFLTDLQTFLPSGKQKHGELSALVLGAGGAARAVVYALVKDGWKVTIAARRIEQAQQLASRFGDVDAIELNLSALHLSNLQLLVNATPLGMTPNIDQSPLPDSLVLSRETMVYDLVYNPLETKLVHEARLQGLKAATGLGMLIEQAALAFELWTECTPSREIMRSSME